MIWTVLLAAVLAAAFTPALLRDTRRADQRRRLREWLASRPPELQRMADEFDRFARQIGEAMVPVMAEIARMGAVLATRLQPIAEAMREAEREDRA